MTFEEKLAVCLCIFIALLVFVGWTSYRRGLKEAKICTDCAGEIEADGLCQDCRTKLWGEQL